MKRTLAIAFVLLMICSTALAYVGNRNSRKFHYDTCRAVHQMKDSNKVYIEKRENAISQGYTPCGICHP